MSTIVVKNFPDDLHGRLKERAERNHRSMTKEVVHLIAAGLDSDQQQERRRLLPTSIRSAGGRQVTTEEVAAPVADHSTELGQRPDGREALRTALIEQPDGSYMNVLGIEDAAFFDALDRIRAETKVRDVSHLFDDTP